MTWSSVRGLFKPQKNPLPWWIDWPVFFVYFFAILSRPLSWPWLVVAVLVYLVICELLRRLYVAWRSRRRGAVPRD